MGFFSCLFNHLPNSVLWRCLSGQRCRQQESLISLAMWNGDRLKMWCRLDLVNICQSILWIFIWFWTEFTLAFFPFLWSSHAKSTAVTISDHVVKPLKSFSPAEVKFCIICHVCITDTCAALQKGAQHFWLITTTTEVITRRVLMLIIFAL